MASSEKSAILFLKHQRLVSMETTPAAARVIAGPCHPGNPYSGWYGSATAHQMAHGASQSSLIPFAGAHGTSSHVMATNQAGNPMYNLHNQYHYNAVGSTSTGTPPAMSMTHGFIGSHHHPPGFGHPGASGGDHGSMGSPFAAPFLFNVDRPNDREYYYSFLSCFYLLYCMLYFFFQYPQSFVYLSSLRKSDDAYFRLQ